MKTPEEISQAIRDDYFRRYKSWEGLVHDEDSLDTLIVGAVSPLCQRIECLTAALREALTLADQFSSYVFTETDEARLRSILGDSGNG